MGTHARYVLWAGIALKESDANEDPFVSRVEESIDGVKYSDLKFSTIGMHGETIGVGVIIQELDWKTVGEGATAYDPVIVRQAEEVLNRVQHVLQELGIKSQAKLHHHLDLGG